MKLLHAPFSAYGCGVEYLYRFPFLVCRLSAEIGRVAGRMPKKASALHRVASEVAAESLRLTSVRKAERCESTIVEHVTAFVPLQWL